MHHPPPFARTTVAAVAVVALSLPLAGCGSRKTTDTTASAGYPLTVQDCGREITVDALPQRVMTVGQSAVELLDAAGAGDRIVARSGEFGAPLPEGLANPPADDLVVDPSDPTTEEIIAASPDLVFGYGLFDADSQQLADAGIELLTVQAECGHDGGQTAAPDVGLGTVSDDVRRLGTVFGTSQTAEAAAAAMDERVASAQRSDTGQTAAWVYYFSSEDSLSAHGGSGIAASVMEKAGLDNVYGDRDEAYLTVSVENLLEQEPHWIVLTYGMYGESMEEARAKFLAEPGVGTLDAVEQGRLVLLPAGASNPSPTAAAGLEELVSQTGG